ncbi:MAG: 7-carboxy-7-deazaguanine synthase [Pseudomonadota bacterium]
MTYSVKELYLTLQGEGAQAGRLAVFCRFAGCNLWSGLERDRASAVCRFCDTDFVGTDGPGGGRFENAMALANAARRLWPPDFGPKAAPFLVCTGGEPLLQLDEALIDAFHDEGFQIAIETNGTLPAPMGIDWICVSPKAGAPLRQREGDELKLVFPQAGLTPDMVADLAFDHYLLQPLDDADRDQHTALAIAYCKTNPQWRLSLQTHKYLSIP